MDESAPGPEQPEWTFVVSLIDFENGGMDFSDLSLPLPFEVRIAELNGSVTTIDSSSVEPAAVRLEGQVGDYGLARIDGKLAVFDPLANTDITMDVTALSREEVYTDSRIGSIRKMIPVTLDGEQDSSRPVQFIGSMVA